MRILKKSLALIMALTLLVGTLAVSASAANPFTDVPSDAYYAEPVAWASEQGITSGTSATTFSPDSPCTRAQVVTFLWRTMGSPAPATSVNPFTDVPTGQYYTDPVLWAMKNGITSGTSTTTFSPDGTCTRAQAVTFLWRAMGSPEPTTTVNPFTDVPAGQYYTKPVLWAVENNITSGTSASTFSPEGLCTRAHVVTFLYRTFTSSDELRITQQPKSVTYTSDVPETMTLTVAAIGGASGYYDYQWHYIDPESGEPKLAAMIDWAEGWGGDTLTVDLKKMPSTSITFFCIVADGPEMAYSESAVVTIPQSSADTALRITQQPKSVTYTEGDVPETATLTVAAAGGASGYYDYQWHYIDPESGEPKLAAMIDWAEGWGGASFTVDLDKMPGATMEFFCIVADGAEIVTSSHATISLPGASAALRITQQPKSVTYTEGDVPETMTLTVAAVGGASGNYDYQWHYIDPESGEPKLAAMIDWAHGWGGDTLTVDLDKMPDSTMEFFCIVADGAEIVTSEHATVTVPGTGAALHITQQPESVTFSEGNVPDSVTLTVAAAGGPSGSGEYDYQWKYVDPESGKSTVAQVSWTEGWLTDTLTIDLTAMPYSSVTFFCVVADAAAYTTSDEATVTIPEDSSRLHISQQPETPDFSKTIPDTLTLEVAAEGGVTGNYDYQWHFIDPKTDLPVRADLTMMQGWNSNKLTIDVLTLNENIYDLYGTNELTLFCIVSDAAETVKSDSVTLVLPVG